MIRRAQSVRSVDPRLTGQEQIESVDAAAIWFGLVTWRAELSTAAKSPCDYQLRAHFLPFFSVSYRIAPY